MKMMPKLKTYSGQWEEILREREQRYAHGIDEEQLLALQERTPPHGNLSAAGIMRVQRDAAAKRGVPMRPDYGVLKQRLREIYPVYETH
ncbi:DUF5678 domain-containing protein [Caenorhabditis elegans]|uniref:DUF5678 domain-containing protein n=1 Tax=Caenorhabditis elegans TaxID=6239 RepID=Q86N74_CAEEL|nr:DUF5678 domain-containing protein [Caenorhabditis elegans]CCD71652.1 DUF5678 domain-containing protein [Caenorhabditis elegans]|eukprot:NP_508369.3 Uncharacterized protein CELE_Y40A1A.3 [Caenorhabditis elegans]